MSNKKWYNFFGVGNITKGAVRYTKRFGSVFANWWTGLNVKQDDTTSYYIEGFEQNDVVNSIVHHVTNGVSKARWYIRDKASGKEVKIPHFEAMKLKSSPEPKTFSEVLMDGVAQKMISGDAYYVGEKGSGINRTKFSHLYVLPSDTMRINGTQRGIVSYSPNSVESNVDFAASNVLHLKDLNPIYNTRDATEWNYGKSRLIAVRDSIKTYNESKQASYYFTKNKGAQKAILLDENTDLGLDGETQMKSALRGSGQGAENNGNTIILQGVKDVVDLSADPKKALVLEQRAQSAQEICNVYNFPSQLIGLKNSTYQNAKEAKKAKWEDCIIPELQEIKDGFNRWFIPQNYGDQYELCYDLSHIDALREDRPVQDLANIATVNEARLRIGLPPLADARGEELYIGFVQRAETTNSSNNEGNKKEQGSQQSTATEDS